MKPLHNTEEAAKLEVPQVQYQPIVQDPVTYKMAKELATEVAAMKKLLKQSSKLGQDERFQNQYNRLEKGKENENAVLMHKKKEEKKKVSPSMGR